MCEGFKGFEEGVRVEFAGGRVDQVIGLLQHLADVDRVAMVEEILKEDNVTRLASLWLTGISDGGIAEDTYSSIVSFVHKKITQLDFFKWFSQTSLS